MSQRQGAVAGWWQERTRHWQFHPPIKTAFTITSLLLSLVAVFVYLQFRGELRRRRR